MSHAVRTAPTGPKRRVSFMRATPPFCLLAVAGAAALVAVPLVAAVVALFPFATAFVAVSLIVVVSVAVAVVVVGSRGCERIRENPCRLGGGGLLRRHSGGRRWRWRWRWSRGGGRGRRLRRPEMRPQGVAGPCRLRHRCDDRVPGGRTPRHVCRRRHDVPCELCGGRRGDGSGRDRRGGPVHHAMLLLRSDPDRRSHHRRRRREMGQHERRSDFRRLDQPPRQEQEPPDHCKRQAPRGQLWP